MKKFNKYIIPSHFGLCIMETFNPMEYCNSTLSSHVKVKVAQSCLTLFDSMGL